MKNLSRSVFFVFALAVLTSADASPRQLPPHPAKQTTVTLDTWNYVEWDDGSQSGRWRIAAENAAYAVALTSKTTDHVAGVYTLDDLNAYSSYVYVYGDEDETLLYLTAGSVTMSVDENGSVTADGTFTCSDNNTYHITIVYAEKPVETGEWDIEITSLFEQYYESDNDVYLILQNADNTCRITLDIFVGEGQTGLEPGKTYTLDDMDTYESGIYFHNTPTPLAAATVTKTLDANNLEHLAGRVEDEYGRILNFTYDETPFIPTGDTVTHSFAGGVMIMGFPSLSEWLISASDNDFAFQLDIVSMNAESPVGEFDSSNGGFDLDFTYLYVANGDSDYQLLYAHDAKAHIFERNDSIVIETDIMAENGVLYRFDAFYSAKTEPEEGILPVEAASSAAKRVENGMLIIEKNGVKYNAVGERIR